MSKEKTNVDFARQINQFYRAEVVWLERRTEKGTQSVWDADTKQYVEKPWSMTYDAIVSDPCPGGRPPKHLMERKLAPAAGQQ